VTGIGRHTLVVDCTVAVKISLSYHLIDLFVCQLLSEVRHDVTQFGRADVPVHNRTPINQTINQWIDRSIDRLIDRKEGKMD